MSNDPRRKRHRFPFRLGPFVFKAVVLVGQVAILVWKHFHPNE